MEYVDGYLIAVPTANKEAYEDLARKTGAIMKKHGALSVVECWGDDIPEGKINSLNTAVLLKPDETIVFSWVVWPDRKTRDSVHKAMVREMEEVMGNAPMPFDGSRMIFGGFDVMLKV